MKTYTVEQAADVLQVTVNTVREYAREGRLRGSKLVYRTGLDRVPSIPSIFD
jgi:excisionase family DNA binding protein